jgi:Xaa-Pro aminopeptidase
MTSPEKLAALRRLMRREGLAAYLVPSNDPHLGEYLPECWKRRHWLSGFTGSAGDLVVTMREAGLWTDSRYFLEAGAALDPRAFKLFKKGLPGTPTIEQFLARKLRRGDVVGIDPQVLSRAWGETVEAALAAKGVRLGFPSRNLIDEIWRDRPPMPAAPFAPFPERLAGESVRSKLARLRKELAGLEADAHVIVALDAIAWLFNVRGADVAFNPFVVAYAIVTRRGATLFVAPEKVTPAVRRALRGCAQLAAYTETRRALRALGREHARVLIDPETTNRWILDQLKGAQVKFAPSPVMAMKAVKNATEVRGMRAAHVRDGVALARFFHWLEWAGPRERLTESDLAACVDALRADETGNRGPSFDSIVSFGGNGAIIHYRPIPGEDARVRRRGILLIDSGGQYLEGTTDVTRTVTLGRPTRRERELFTRVLKGHINLSRTRFPKGTKGAELEALARQALWMGGLHYSHGTGHGVGHYLAVHEGPVGFSARNPAVLEAGNIISVEPGYYLAGRYGFRTENLVVITRDPQYSTKEQEWLRLEPLTLCPIDLRLVEPALLSVEETVWLNAYHREVYREIGVRLAPEARAWLRRATQPIRQAPRSRA